MTQEQQTQQKSGISKYLIPLILVLLGIKNFLKHLKAQLKKNKIA